MPSKQTEPLWIFKKPRRRAPKTARKRALAAFYKSPEWQAQRIRVLIRDGWICRFCGEAATECEHTEYHQPLSSTPDEMILSCCWDCQQEQRQRRIAGGAR